MGKNAQKISAKFQKILSDRAHRDSETINQLPDVEKVKGGDDIKKEIIGEMRSALETLNRKD